MRRGLKVYSAKELLSASFVDGNLFIFKLGPGADFTKNNHFKTDFAPFGASATWG